MYAADVHEFHDHDEVLSDADRVADMRAGLLRGDVYIARNVATRESILGIREYLISIGRSSLPNYRPVAARCPNFHRMDRWDPRAHVGGCFHTFSFFPWNQDVFDLFDRFRSIYQLKNRLTDLEADSFLGHEPDRGCTARMSFQYYPRGSGGLNRHQDPFDYHQITIPSMLMSQKGEDFQQGGGYLESGPSRRILLDDICEPGDVCYFNAKCFHGVDRVDPETPEDWLSFRGRWIALFAVNKVAGNAAISDSQDLERAYDS